MRKGNNINHPAKGSSIKVEPIRAIKDINKIKRLLENSPRNLALFLMGINTSLKVSELRNITIEQLLFCNTTDWLEVEIRRANKKEMIVLHPECKIAIAGLLAEWEKKSGKPNPSDYVFKGRNGPVSIQAVNNLVKKWCADAGLNGNFGSHTLRKTYGYHELIHNHISIDKVMELFNHQSPSQTLNYLCIDEGGFGAVRQKTGRKPGGDDETAAKKDAYHNKRIAELEQVITELKESEEKFKTFFDNANDQIVYTDLEGRVLEVNDATYDIFGQTREEALGKNISELGIFSQDTLDTIVRQSEITAKDNPPPRVELEAFHRNGRTVYIDVNSKLMKKEGEIIGIISIVRDITDRKKVEAALQESREMSRALLNATMDSVMLLDKNGVILDLNASYAEKFNRSVEDTIGLCLWDLLPADMAKKRKEKFDQVFNSGESVRLEEEYQGLWFDNIVYPVLDRNKKVSSVAIFSHDITMRKQAEDALMDHRDKLEKLVRERTANLEDANTALKVLLKRREDDKIELEERMLVNVKELILPYLEELKISRLNDRQKAFVEIMESNLNDVISPFIRGLSEKYYDLSPTEIRVANIIKQGKTTKEIADILKMSPRTIDNHRYNIRKKLGINNQKANLTTHLLSIQ